MNREKLEALANDIMEQCQKQGLTCREVGTLFTMIRSRAADQEMSAADKVLFTAKHF